LDLGFAQSDVREYDEPVTVERDEVEQYRVWEAEDDDSVLVLEDAADEEVMDYLLEQDGWEDVLWASDAQRTKVKFVVQEVREETAFYLEDPPSNAYVDIGRREAFEILERRGIEAENLDDAWYYPRQNKAVFLFVSSDDAGETYKTLREVSNLDSTERGLVDGEWPDDEEETTPIPVLQDEIYENSDFGELKSGVLACYRKGITKPSRIAEELDISTSAANTTIYQIKGKLEKREWEQKHVYPYVPSEKRPDDLLFEE